MKRKIFSILFIGVVVVSFSLITAVPAAATTETIWTIGTFNDSRSEFNHIDFDGVDTATYDADNDDASDFPAFLYVSGYSGSWEEAGVHEVTINFSLDKDYWDVTLTYRKAGGETDEVSLDGGTPQTVTGPGENILQTYDLSLGNLSLGSHSIVIECVSEGTGEGAHTYDALELSGLAVTSIPLLAGQNIDVGTVSVWNDGDTLYVKYETTGGWEITETHLVVTDEWSEIPLNKRGNPMVGHFPYSMEHDPWATEYTYTIDLGDWEPCTDLYIAAHADVYLTEAVVYGTERGPGGAIDNYGDIYEIDLDSRTATYLFRPNLNLGQQNFPNGNAFDTVNNRLYYSSNDSESTPSDLYFYDFATSSQTSAGALVGVSAGASFYNGKYYYIKNMTDDLIEVALDPSGNIFSETKVADITSNAKGWGFGDIVIRSDGILFGSPGGEFFQFDLNTMTYQTISTSAGAEGKQLAFGSNGTLYGHSAGTGEFFIIDPTNGTTTSIDSVTGSATGQFTDLASGPLPRERETAWGYGTRFVEPGNWAMYFTYHVQGILTGTWLLDVNVGTYMHDMFIISQDSSGALSGTGGYPESGPPYNTGYDWTLTGQLTGTSVTMVITYTNNYTTTLTGTVDSSWNSMSGTGTAGVVTWVATRLP